MRNIAALLAVSLLVGCGGSEPASLGTGAAELVPPDAIAFISFDTDLNSEEWRRVMDVWSPVALSIGDLDLDRDVRPAVGDQLDFAILDADDGAESIVWLMQPKDESKLPRLVRVALGPDSTIQKIGGWSVVTDSADASARVRAAHSGRSLADVEWYNKAKAELSGDAVAAGYGYGEGIQQLSDEVALLARVMGSPRWVAARIGVEDDAVRAQVHGAVPQPAPAASPTRLLREVPSGAALAVSFKDVQVIRELQRVIGVPLADLRGEGVLYVLSTALLPIVVLTVESPTPRAAARALETVAAQIRTKTRGALALHVIIRGNRVTLTNGLGPAPRTGAGLVDDPPFKDALAAADVPEEVTWLVYADIKRLMPIIQVLSQLLDSELELQKLERLGTLVAFGTRSGSMSRLEARLTIR